MRNVIVLLLILAVGGFVFGAEPLKAPADRDIRVAFLITQGATMIDFTGPWEVFQDVMLTQDGKPVTTHDQAMQDSIRSPFSLYVVSENKEPLQVTGGMMIEANYTFTDAPQPDVIVIPAQRGSQAAVDWVKKMAPNTAVVMSVCTGAGLLAKTGLLDGLQATTHHWFVDYLAQRFPKVHFVKGQRYVENAKVSTAAGLTSGIDLALRVVERYFGRPVAIATANYMEYHSKLWE
jgi:transcriptional regulator GlxA family with amidase domain